MIETKAIIFELADLRDKSKEAPFTCSDFLWPMDLTNRAGLVIFQDIDLKTFIVKDRYNLFQSKGG